jgi:hypothetical protein
MYFSPDLRFLLNKKISVFNGCLLDNTLINRTINRVNADKKVPIVEP